MSLMVFEYKYSFQGTHRAKDPENLFARNMPQKNSYEKNFL
jgi:hypothetical protein